VQYHTCRTWNATITATGALVLLAVLMSPTRLAYVPDDLERVRRSSQNRAYRHHLCLARHTICDPEVVISRKPIVLAGGHVSSQVPCIISLRCSTTAASMPAMQTSASKRLGTHARNIKPSRYSFCPALEAGGWRACNGSYYLRFVEGEFDSNL
jgi:hypothetical protein